MSVSHTIQNCFRQALEQCEAPVPESFSPDLVLLESGLDSLGFAILVATLEQELGYDPFVLMEDAVYPTTYGEFVAIYTRYQPHS